MNFKTLGINDDAVSVLKKHGISTPTEIQCEAIIPIKEGKDVIGEAQTGTGKTLAFLLPIFENINTNLSYPQLLVLTPTRELALQISKECEKFAEYRGINTLAVYGGRDVNQQLKKLTRGVHVIVATPGRLIDHINRGTVDLSKVKSFVIDEADQMLLMGFKNDVEKVERQLPKKRQTLCFSATLNSDVKKLAYRYTTEPINVSVESEEITLTNIKQEVVETSDRHKQDSLLTALNEDNPFLAIIFCRTKRRADVLEEAMKSKGYNCDIIHSDIKQSKRERIIKSFRDAKLQYLIATDVASRGLDIEGVSHIYNYDMPETPEIYIHRIGRTGRRGDTGYTCLFAAQKDMRLLKDIETAIEYKIPRREITL
ncbi:MAG: DEAD/DEAH box helicase [Clostridium sp.]|uniref:DEAD/DEAH box helicase n=1 Tax=Clostridium sp. TaxID=1506 RepID=UPI002FC941FA